MLTMHPQIGGWGVFRIVLDNSTPSQVTLEKGGEAAKKKNARRDIFLTLFVDILFSVN